MCNSASPSHGASHSQHNFHKLRHACRSFDEYLIPASYGSKGLNGERAAHASRVMVQPASQSMLHGLLPQVVALLAAGYQCSSNLMLALDPTRQAEQPGEGNVGSLFCFDPSVSAWARVAAERHNTSVSRQHTNSSPWEIDNEVDYGHHGRQGGALGAPGSSTTSVSYTHLTLPTKA